MSEWLSREEALERLRVRPQTLYAYVSRGRIGMRPDRADPRRSEYRADDIAALATRRARGRSPSAIAESAIAWGEPSIVTAISTVWHGQLIYRGRDAVALSDHATLEETAAVLWALPEPVRFEAPPDALGQVGRAPAFAQPALIAGQARPSLGRSAASLCADAARAIGVLAGALGASPGPEPVHRRLARGWSVDDRGAEAIRRALVLLADHELNASTFAARVAASTGASPAAAVMQLAEDAARHGADATIRRWLGHDRPLPGFGHPLYPEGDPRATALLTAIDNTDETLRALETAAIAATGAPANIDFALAVLTRSLGLPRDAPFHLFALGRSVGWAAHMVEQIVSGSIIRPRGRYEGLLP
jgi:citrate synthase